MKSSTTVFALLLAAMTCQAVEPSAESLTWQEANRRSAALIKGWGPSTEAADLARMAFDLYPQQTKSYNATNHAQLLLNAADARHNADGSEAAVKEIDRGAEAIARVAGSKSDVLIPVWQEGARFAGQSTREAARFNEQALARAEELLGPDDTRTISLLLDVVEGQRRKKGYTWAASMYVTARERAAKAGEDSVRVAEIDMLMAKLRLENGKLGAIETYRSLMDRFEKRTDRESLLQVAYAMLEVAYEEKRDTRAVAEIRQRRSERLAHPVLTDPGTVMGDGLVPVSRVMPVYPRNALRDGQQGFVEFHVRVAPDGSVLDLKVLRSEPKGVFDASARKALRHWKFKPKIVDGQAVESSGLQRLDYALEAGY